MTKTTNVSTVNATKTGQATAKEAFRTVKNEAAITIVNDASGIANINTVLKDTPTSSSEQELDSNLGYTATANEEAYPTIVVKLKAA